jgi:hypothetical protein
MVLLSKIVPVKCWQDFLIRKHTAGCRLCQSRLAEKEAVCSLLIPADAIENTKDFWPGVKAALLKPDEEDLRPRLSLGSWVFRAALFLVVVGVGLWLYNSQRAKGPQLEGSSQERFHINYIMIDNEPAQTYLYQPLDSEMIFVWAEKEKNDKS